MVGLTGKLVIWTQVMAFCAVVAIVVSILQWTAMRDQYNLTLASGVDTRAAIAAANRQADLAVDANAGAQSTAADTRHQTDKALAIAQKNANAARGQLEVSEDTARRQLRAYLNTDASDPPILEAGKLPTALVKFENAGQTPAYGFASTGQVFINETPPWISEQRPPAALFKGVRGAALGRGTLVTVWGRHALTSAELADINAGKDLVVVAGRGHYQDIFHHWHSLSYCHVLLRNPDSGRLDYRRCAQGNYAE